MTNESLWSLLLQSTGLNNHGSYIVGRVITESCISHFVRVRREEAVYHSVNYPLTLLYAPRVFQLRFEKSLEQIFNTAIQYVSKLSHLFHTSTVTALNSKYVRSILSFSD